MSAAVQAGKATHKISTLTSHQNGRHSETIFLSEFSLEKLLYFDSFSLKFIPINRGFISNEPALLRQCFSAAEWATSHYLDQVR